MKVFGKLTLTLIALVIAALGMCLLGGGLAQWSEERESQTNGCWQQPGR